MRREEEGGRCLSGPWSMLRGRWMGRLMWTDDVAMDGDGGRRGRVRDVGGKAGDRAASTNTPNRDLRNQRKPNLP